MEAMSKKYKTQTQMMPHKLMTYLWCNLLKRCL